MKVNAERLLFDPVSKGTLVSFIFPKLCSWSSTSINSLPRPKSGIVRTFKNTKRFRGPMVRIPPFQGGGSCSIHGGCIQSFGANPPFELLPHDLAVQPTSLKFMATCPFTLYRWAFITYSNCTTSVFGECTRINRHARWKYQAAPRLLAYCISVAKFWHGVDVMDCLYV